MDENIKRLGSKVALPFFFVFLEKDGIKLQVIMEIF